MKKKIISVLSLCAIAALLIIFRSPRPDPRIVKIKSFEIYLPIRVDHIQMWDNGQQGLVIKDDRDSVFSLFLENGWESPKPYAFFIGAYDPMYPGDSAAVKLHFAGAEEKMIIDMLQEYVSTNLSEEEQARLSQIKSDSLVLHDKKTYTFWYVIDFIDSMKLRYNNQPAKNVK